MPNAFTQRACHCGSAADTSCQENADYGNAGKALRDKVPGNLEVFAAVQNVVDHSDNCSQWRSGMRLIYTCHRAKCSIREPIATFMVGSSAVGLHKHSLRDWWQQDAS
jgi:hypothetical protein